MKAELTANGTLIVTAENGLEVFALQAWSDDYFKYTSRFSTNDGTKITGMPKTSILIQLFQEDTE